MNAPEWLQEAREDIHDWRLILPCHEDNTPVDWGFIAALDMSHGFASMAHDPMDRLAENLQVRDKVERTIRSMRGAYLRDTARTVDSYRLARALAYWNRRLTDNIRLEDPERERRESAKDSRRRPPSTGRDWRTRYLPGRGVDRVLGIDLETTGLNPMRDYIIDVGFESMNMRTPPPENREDCRYEEPAYRADGAYAQHRMRFAVPTACAQAGNRTILDLTGIDIRWQLDAATSGLHVFDEWIPMQEGLLQRLIRQPYVAHNATFEHGFLMLNVTGYAEAYRAGFVTIIDTLPMSRDWDPDKPTDARHPQGYNSLDAYAKRHGALPMDAHERHLGLEDAHVMLLAMRNHLQDLEREGRGPWAHDGVAGYGGCRHQG